MTDATSTQPATPAESRQALEAVDLSRYAWRDENRTAGFPTWQAEIEHMESIGFKLVPPGYKVPHWSEKMRAGEPKPKLYVSGRDGPREMDAALDRYAAELGYPLYYQPNA